jgi:hypothetical protein
VGDVFDSLKPLLERYSPPFTAREGLVRDKRDYQLYSEKEVEVAGRKRDEVFFAGLIQQKGYVGFYFMPVYAEPERKSVFAPELLQLLKGKSCFHIRQLDDGTRESIDDALAKGYALFEQRGWV